MNTPLQKTKKRNEAITAVQIDAVASTPPLNNDEVAGAILDAIATPHPLTRTGAQLCAPTALSLAPNPRPLPPEELPLYPTNQYRDLNIPYCDRCGEKARTGMHGEPICPVNLINCGFVDG